MWSLSPHVWPDQRVPPQHGAGLRVGQVGGGLAVDGQDQVADAQAAVAADGAALDDAADQHPQAVLRGADGHPCLRQIGQRWVRPPEFSAFPLPSPGCAPADATSQTSNLHFTGI